jgi:hypothetical protein
MYAPGRDELPSAVIGGRFSILPGIGVRSDDHDVSDGGRLGTEGRLTLENV